MPTHLCVLSQGFVVCMGTDTMAFAASALSFMLENLGKAVVFTGSQIPFSEAYNDARRNLIVSCIFAASEDSPPEVSSNCNTLKRLHNVNIA
jgi:L-asparaginase